MPASAVMSVPGPIKVRNTPPFEFMTAVTYVMLMLRTLSALARGANATKEMTNTHTRRFILGYSFYHSAPYCKASMLRPAMARKWGLRGHVKKVLFTWVRRRTEFKALIVLLEQVCSSPE